LCMQSGSERMGSMDAGKGPCLAARAESAGSCVCNLGLSAWAAWTLERVLAWLQGQGVC